MNWPNGMNYGHSNWTNRMPRTSAHHDGGWLYVERPHRRGGRVLLACLALALVGVVLAGI